MASQGKRKIGNRIAPVRFIIFLIAFAFLGGAIQVETRQWHYAVMGGFDLAAVLFFALLVPTLRDGEASAIRRHAAENDANRGMLLVITALIGAVLLIDTAWITACLLWSDAFGPEIFYIYFFLRPFVLDVNRINLIFCRYFWY